MRVKLAVLDQVALNGVTRACDDKAGTMLSVMPFSCTLVECKAGEVDGTATSMCQAGCRRNN